MMSNQHPIRAKVRRSWNHAPGRWTWIVRDVHQPGPLQILAGGLADTWSAAYEAAAQEVIAQRADLDGEAPIPESVAAWQAAWRQSVPSRAGNPR